MMVRLQVDPYFRENDSQYCEKVSFLRDNMNLILYL